MLVNEGFFAIDTVVDVAALIPPTKERGFVGRISAATYDIKHAELNAIPPE